MSQLGKSQSDEAPCRSCTSFAEYMKKSKKRYISDIAKTGDDNNNNLSEMKPPKDCPPDKGELGKSTWTFLHTMAARYPETPSSDDKRDMFNFFHIFAKFYPCDFCAQDFTQEIQKDPPQVSSQEDLSQWLCRLHNIVNVKIGKKEFDCSLVNQRWRDGWLDGSCG